MHLNRILIVGVDCCSLQSEGCHGFKILNLNLVEAEVTLVQCFGSSFRFSPVVCSKSKLHFLHRREIADDYSKFTEKH